MKTDFSTVLTPKEVAEITRTSEETIINELKAGCMKGFRVGNEWRVTEEQLLYFINGETKHNSISRTTVPYENLISPDWSQADSFSYSWPASDKRGQAPENYPKAYETKIDLPSGKYNVKIGYTTRKAAGIKDRKRITIFITFGNQFIPVVEFVGANDFKETHRVASIIKTKNGRHIRSADQLPEEYKNMETTTYSDIVRGPHASHGLAVVTDATDKDTMLRHALIRATYKGWV